MGDKPTETADAYITPWGDVENIGPNQTHVTLGSFKVDGARYNIKAELPGRRGRRTGLWVTMAAIVICNAALALVAWWVA